MKRFIALAFLLCFALPAIAQLSQVQRQESHIINIIGASNPGFENGGAEWSPSPSAPFSTTTSNPIRGLRSGVWDPTAVSQQLVAKPVLVPIELRGRPCLVSFKYIWDSGSTGDIFVDLEDGGSNQLLDLIDLVPTSNSRVANFEAGFVCPSSATQVVLTLQSAADAASIKIDSFHIGTDYRIGSNPHVSTTAQTFTPTGTWIANTTYTGIWWQEGEFAVVENTITLSGAPNSTQLQVDPPPGCTPDTSKIVSGSIINGVTPLFATDFVLQDSGSSTYRAGYVAYSSSSGGRAVPVVYSDVSTWESIAGVTQAVPITFDDNDIIYLKYSMPCEEFAGDTSDQTVTLETQGWYVSSYLDSANPSLGTTDNSGTFFRVSNPGLEMVNNPGSEPVEIPCEAPTPPEGLTCNTAAVDENVGIAFTIPKAGSYVVRFKYSQSQKVSGGAIASYVKLAETSTTSNTILQEPSKASVYEIDQTALHSHTHGVSIYGIFNFSTAGKKVIRLFESTAVGGSPTTNIMRCDGFTDRHCYWEVYPITQNLTHAVALVGEKDDLDISSSGDFDASQPVLKIAKINNQVTLTWDNLAHSSDSLPLSAVGFIPSKYRPSVEINTVYILGSSVVKTLQVKTDGQLQFNYRDWAGANSSLTSTSSGSVSWVVE